MSLLKDDPTGRIPPGQRVTEKFPVMTAGTPTITPLSDWDLSLWIEAEDGKRREVGRWDHGTIRKLGLAEITCDIHCVTRWSKLDTRWGGVTVDRLLTNASIDPAAEAGDLPLRYLLAECDGDYSANLRLEDLHAENGFVALDYDGAPLP
ncbi:MAG: molybdopterin-dependent oxidoreductase, partial [Pseudomonadota bacterium]